MNQKIFTLKILIIFCLGIIASPSYAGDCPDDLCTVEVPQGMAEDTIYLGALPNGTVGVYYDNDVSFRMPKTTTPVNEVDPDIPTGLTINQIDILGLSNLPSGLSWESNQTSYNPAVETDGCFNFNGTPFQAGTYLIEVTVEATILVFTQQAVFYMEITIDPSLSVTEGFTMLNNTGCGEVTVSFQNNIPSNGEDGFSYNWDFGNGNSSLDENPQDQTYSQPGFYVVNYEAEIDTVGYILTRAVITASGCNDIPTAPDWSTNPDIHIEIRDPSGILIYDSEIAWNTAAPIEYFPNIKLLSGNYELKAVDEDSGINGSDDICGIVTFNQLSNGPLITGNFNMHFDIIHPIEVVESSDTVWVFEIPDTPVISNISATSFCEGEMTVLSSSYNEGNQWLRDGVALVDETEVDLEVTESGVYSVVFTNAMGCSAVSEEVSIEFSSLPEEPEYFNENNLLSLLESISYPAGYTFQWYQDNNLLTGETEPFYCAMEDGEYMLEVTDPSTGCINTFVQAIVFNPEAECFVNTEDLASNWNLQIFPNPVSEELNVHFELQEAKSFTLSVYDLLGRRHYFQSVDQRFGTFNQFKIDVIDLVSGMYLLEIKSEDQRLTHKFVIK